MARTFEESSQAWNYSVASQDKETPDKTALFDKYVSRQLEEQQKRLLASFFATAPCCFKTPSASR
jgi:transketolase